ncbi:MAG TPA: hypothetical protein VIH26_07880 [Anaerolineales bacterium]
MADQVHQFPAQLVHASVWIERYIARTQHASAQDHAPNHSLERTRPARRDDLKAMAGRLPTGVLGESRGR